MQAGENTLYQGFPTFRRILSSIDDILIIISVSAMVSVAAIVTVDVILRYLFSHPLIWAYDLIGLYMMAVLFFLALPHSLRHQSHVCVDVLVQYIPRRGRHLIEGVGYAATTVLLVTLFWLTADRLYVGFTNGEMVYGAVALPSWISQLPVAVGIGILSIHCCIRSLAHILSLWSPVPLIEFSTASESYEEYAE